MEDRENFDMAVVVKDNQIEALVQNNPSHTTRAIEDIVQISNEFCKVFEKHLET